jgi:transcriptional regulator with XRE-family HTH domain
MDVSGSGSRGPLADFLSARRALVTAAEAGLPETGFPRRVPGLRREEVAHLAGISTDYYTRLEQGRLRTASPGVLHAVGRALRLDADQQRHLLRLAHPEEHRFSGADGDRVCPRTERLLANLADTPGLVLGRHLDILSWNRLGSALFADLGARDARHRNYVRMVFLDPHTRSLLCDWERHARDAVAHLRMSAGATAGRGRARLEELVGELSVRDADFATWWGQHIVAATGFRTFRLDHPVVGRFELDWHALTAIEADGPVLSLLSAAPGTPDHAAVRRLDAWAEEQGITGR